MPTPNDASGNPAALDSQLANLRVVPVVVLDRADDAAPLADALVRGGIGCMEVTFRTAAAAEAIAAVARRDDILVVAGTVITAEDAVTAIDVGARFVVSPGFDDGVADVCRKRSVHYLPGAATPTEIMRARAAGLGVVKLFPAEPIGGLATLKALAAPFPDVRFVPTGGIDEARAADYLAHPAVLAVGGSWMVPRDAIGAGDWARIGELAHGAARLRGAKSE